MTFPGPSASSYMEPEKFDGAGITFEYMQYDYPEYSQMYPPYDPYVSILDLMFMDGMNAGDYFEKGKEREPRPNFI
ncbi:MAG: WbqC family protein [Anaerolineales bacterium]